MQAIAEVVVQRVTVELTIISTCLNDGIASIESTPDSSVMSIIISSLDRASDRLHLSQFRPFDTPGESAISGAAIKQV